jgi:hypothetical protein
MLPHAEVQRAVSASGHVLYGECMLIRFGEKVGTNCLLLFCDSSDKVVPNARKSDA